MPRLETLQVGGLELYYDRELPTNITLGINIVYHDSVSPTSSGDASHGNAAHCKMIRNTSQRRFSDSAFPRHRSASIRPTSRIQLQRDGCPISISKAVGARCFSTPTSDLIHAVLYPLSAGNVEDSPDVHRGTRVEWRERREMIETWCPDAFPEWSGAVAKVFSVSPQG